MNKELYKETFSRVHSACENKTEVIMDKYNSKRKINFRRKPVMAFAAVLTIMLFSLTAYAIVAILTPADIARELGYDALAEDFQSGSGVVIEESVVSEGYILTLHGLSIGKDLGAFRAHTDIDAEQTYTVISIRREDGTPMDLYNNGFAFNSVALFEGYKPWGLNSIHLGLGGSAFEEDGVLYIIKTCSESLEMFADGTVYYAIWDRELGFPNSDIFKVDENGRIAFADGLDKAHAMFTLPLDPSKADPERIKEILDEIGLSIDDVTAN